MKKPNNVKGFAQWKKEHKRRLVAGAIIGGAALTGVGVGIGYTVSNKTVVDTVINYVDFNEVKQFFKVDGNILRGFNYTSANEDLATLEQEEIDIVFNQWMIDHKKNGIDFGSFSEVPTGAFGLGKAKGTSFASTGQVKAIKFKKVDSIAADAFMLCESLEQISLGSSKNLRLYRAFDLCSNLRKVAVDEEARFTEISKSFSGCTLLKNRANFEITDKNLENIGSWNGNGGNAYIEKNDGQGCISSIAFGEVSIKNWKFDGTDTEIKEKSFSNITNLTGITEWPESSTSKKIPDEMFINTSLTNVEIPAWVEEIGENAFEGCQKLKIVKISNDSELKKINGSAFKGCISLSDINNLPNSMSEIGNSAFNGCISLRTFSFSSSTTSTNKMLKFGSDSFYDCNWMKTFDLGGKDELDGTIGSGCFNNCGSPYESGKKIKVLNSEGEGNDLAIAMQDALNPQFGDEYKWAIEWQS